MSSVRIVSVPPGEAPLAVREAWVGLELPSLRNRPGRYLNSGVLSGPRNIAQSLLRLITFRASVDDGYLVPALPAIETLERSNPAAARWWRDNTPHIVMPRRYLVFPVECCEPVP